jgi:hypothetical protein
METSPECPIFRISNIQAKLKKIPKRRAPLIAAKLHKRGLTSKVGKATPVAVG